jgi:hypothetical protein
MTPDQAKQLREVWKLLARANLCPHERLEPEHTPDGAWTGQYICVTCGAEVVVRSGLEGALYA